MVHHRLALIAVCAAILTAVHGATAQQEVARKAVWIGIGFTLEKEIPSVEGMKPELGFRINFVPYGSPAERAGVLVDDVIVGMDGQDFPADEPAKQERQFRESIMQHMPGDEITLHLIRDAVTKSAQVSGTDVANEELWRNAEAYLLKQPAGATARLTAVHERRVMNIKVLVEERPVGVGGTRNYSSFGALERTFPKVSRPEEQLANALIDELRIGEGYKDLRQRLARLSGPGDRFRLSRVAYIQHEPFQLQTLAGNTLDEVAAAISQRNPLAVLRVAAEWLDAAVSAPPRPLRTGLNLDQHLEQLVRLFEEVRAKRDEGFSKLTSEDRKYLEENCDAVFNAFSNRIGLDQDQDQERWRNNSRVLELAARVDFMKLFEGAELLWQVAQDKYLDDLESAVRKAWEAAGKPEGIFIERESPVGKILVGGNGSTWYREDAAIVLDLAGKDFYTNNAGSTRGNAIPVALLVDFAGDDAYEATFNWTQAAAQMGHSVLIDRKGNDEYIGREWAQGAAVLGAALFLDESGSDVYRSDQYAQGVAAWGIAIHMDYEGDDVYDAHLLSQGVGMPGGAGWLLNGKGNDSYYSKGKHPTDYGDAGIFDSWSQGCGVGFRGLQSGGVALLYDGAGRDRYQAGNFSQGGGYYFGIGLLRDGGEDNDVYIGSRYNQGFAAHQAIGFFEEAGGNDFYTTRQSVAQGLSWDETITVFIDHRGDDVYEGGEGFSQGASAHNGFCLFLDLGGRNRFLYSQPQGSAGPNDFHGGKSFSMFVAADGKRNAYTSKMKSSSIHLNGELGIFADIPSSIENALKTKSWRRLIKKD